ncbi:hypothetical protein [Clostridium estertheticum]|nr:hypothetical protein [Clostridium estertheticum]
MFPYGDEEKFKEHDFYKRIKEVRESVEYIAFYQPITKFKQDLGL